RDRFVSPRGRSGAGGYPPAGEEALGPVAAGRTGPVRRLPDDARGCVPGERDHPGHPPGPVGPGRPARRDQRPCRSLRGDGRSLPAGACSGHQGSRAAPAGPPAGSGSPATGVSEEDHPGGRGTDPSMLGEVPEGRLVGLVSVRGAGSSHVAILARAMGIPTVMGALDMPYLRMDGMDLIVDGNAGEVYCNPSQELRRHYRELIREELELSHGLAKLRDQPCVTLDGHRIPLWVNTGLYADIARS